MNVLVVGGAGYVGSILRPALEREHTCRYLDLRPVAGREAETVVGDVNDPAAVAEAVAGTDAVVYLAMGVVHGDKKDVNNPGAAFQVNVQGLYAVLAQALKAGVGRVVFASSLSVYDALGGRRIDEAVPPDAWGVYGFTKRLGEAVCAAAAQRFPTATVTALRLMLPRSDEDWAKLRETPPASAYAAFWQRTALGPEDTRRLFLAALALDRPGYHVIQATGDPAGEAFPLHRAQEVLGWRPEGR